jgi:hypothetical protein
MPAGTPPKAVLSAARNFLREEFGLKHRYAFVLHTDEPHPHVHAVVKAASEDGVRLNIRKATLRRWRSEFARHLRAGGVAANATERAVRGQVNTSPSDSIYRVMRDQRRDSTFIRGRVEKVANAVTQRLWSVDPAGEGMRATREVVVQGWRAVAAQLLRDNKQLLGELAQKFVARMPSARTDRERIAAELVALVRDRKARSQEIAR